MTNPSALSMNFLRKMIEVRKFEEACAELYSAGHIRGFLHLYIGQEAVSVGVLQTLNPEDVIFATYREHAHALLRGVSAERIMAEMFGRVSGCCRGRGGSMHIFDANCNFIGGNAIVAGALPMAAGMGLALKAQRSPGISVCFFGEGAMAEGEFHEAMNLAAIWNLPVLFVCENNHYAMGTALERWEAQTDLVRHAESYGVTSRKVDGMDVMEVYHAAKEASCFVREFKKPFFLECETYRFRAHSMFDGEKYRSKEEVAIWKERDPISTFKDTLREKGVASVAEIEEMEQAVDTDLRAAIETAQQSPLESPSELLRFTYAETPGT